MVTNLVTLKEVLGSKKASNRIEIDHLIRKGLPLNVMFRIMELLCLNDRDIAKIAGVSPRTIGRIKESGDSLDLVVSDRLFRVANIIAFASEVFGGIGPARVWLKSPQFSLSENTPLELLQTEAGAKEVEVLLGRIKYGVYS